MWTNITKQFLSLKLNSTSPINPFVCQQLRSTHVLKRRWPPGLHKSHLKSKIMKAKHFVYDTVEMVNSRKHENIDVILSTQVSGLGNRGDKISMKPIPAYYKLLLPGLAVYASPDNVKKYSDDGEKLNTDFSSPYVRKLMEILSYKVIYVMMNNSVPWKIEPWHVAMALRVAGIHAPRDALELPEKPITGPNMELEGKYFNIAVTINSKEKVTMKCVIHHWNPEVGNQMPRMRASDLSVDHAVFPELKEKIDTSDNRLNEK